VGEVEPPLAKSACQFLSKKASTYQAAERNVPQGVQSRVQSPTVKPRRYLSDAPTVWQARDTVTSHAYHLKTSAQFGVCPARNRGKTI
jgi:hypothetical protein